MAVERDESTDEALRSGFEAWDAKGGPNRRGILRSQPLRSIRLTNPPLPSAEAVEAMEEEMQEAFLKSCEGNIKKIFRSCHQLTVADDAIDDQGRRVEIKATTRTSIGLSAPGTRAERLVVVVVDGDGETEIAYDGPTAPAWDAAGKPQKNGQRRISVSTLKKLAG